MIDKPFRTVNVFTPAGPFPNLFSANTYKEGQEKRLVIQAGNWWIDCERRRIS